MRSPLVKAANKLYVGQLLKRVRLLRLTPQEKKEQQLDNPVEFSSEDEQERASTTCMTKSEMIDWSLGLKTPRQSAHLSTATIAYGEVGINGIEFAARTASDGRNQSSLASAKSSTSSEVPEEQAEYRASDSSMTR